MELFLCNHRHFGVGSTSKKGENKELKWFGRGSEKERDAAQHRHEIMVAHTQSRQMNLSTKQQLDSLGRAYYLQEDENVVQAINRYCPELIPAFSRLNATGNIDNPKDRRLMELRLEDLLLHQEMDLGDEGDVETRSFIKSLRMYGIWRIMDAIKGYRGTLVTNDVERVTHEFVEPKKKGIL